MNYTTQEQARALIEPDTQRPLQKDQSKPEKAGYSCCEQINLL
jgi:hypothetical protein